MIVNANEQLGTYVLKHTIVLSMRGCCALRLLNNIILQKIIENIQLHGVFVSIFLMLNDIILKK